MAQLTLTATQARAALRRELRDPAPGTLWTDADLNECAHEALRMALSFFPRVATSVPVRATNRWLRYELPADCERVLAVRVGRDTYAFGKLDWDAADVVAPLDGWHVRDSGAKRYLVLDAALTDRDMYQLVYVAAAPTGAQDGSGDVDTSTDFTAAVFVPAGVDHLARDYFYAVAREAAYRMQLNTIDAGGGAQWEKLYSAAVDRRREAQAYLPGRPLAARVVNGVF